MTDVRKLIAALAEEEEAFRQTTFLAPCRRGGSVRARVAGLVRTFAPEPREFQGWGLFRPLSEKTAELVEEAELPLVARYLALLPALRVRLAHPLEGQSWLAYPVNEGDARQRWGTAKPVPVHFVTDGAQFEQIAARWDGGAWWFDDLDRQADPRVPEQLEEALRKVVPPEALRFKGLTPEMRTVYELAAQRAEGFRKMIEERRAEERLRGALALAGGDLRRYRDRGDFWQVEWTTRDGQQHTSAIEKRDLTVVSSGICLSGRDRDFDLQSLVGVMEGQ